MLHENLQAYSLGFVFIGEINPVIIQPFWLASKGLIREAEAKNAKVDLIHNDVVKFSLDWVEIEVTKQRFSVMTSKEPYFEVTRDLVISIFEILKETPVTQLGINHIKSFGFRDEPALYEFANKLTPLNYWDENFEEPRLLNLEIIDEKRKDGLLGSNRMRITPTDISLGINYGVSFNFNDHFVVSPGDPGRKGEMIKLAASQFKPSMNLVTHVIESLYKKMYLE